MEISLATWNISMYLYMQNRIWSSVVFKRMKDVNVTPRFDLLLALLGRECPFIITFTATKRFVIRFNFCVILFVKI